MTRRIPLLFATILGLVACASPPERAQPVGRSGIVFTDSERPNWTGDGDRPLITTIWYPAAAGAEESEWTVGLFRAGWTAVDAAIAGDGGPFPLVVLSHGTGGAAAQLSWLAERLASNGYVVAAVNHHGNTAAEERYLPQGFALWWERSRDIAVVIDALLADARFGPRIDSTRIGVAGFSLGGYTALAVAGARTDRTAWQRYCEGESIGPACSLPPEAPFTMAEIDALTSTDPDMRASIERAGHSYRDDRVDAAFVIAPVLGPALDPTSLADIAIPVRILVGEADDQAVPALTAQPVAETIPESELEILPRAGHYVFLAECGLRGRLLVRDLCADPAGVDRGAVHQRVAGDALAFFDRALDWRRERSVPPVSWQAAVSPVRIRPDCPIVPERHDDTSCD